MNNQEFVKLTLENQKLKEENQQLRKRIEDIFKSWLYDSSRYNELKEKYNHIIKDKVLYNC